MGQYYRIVNLSKRQFLYPYKFGDGAKLLEFGCSASGMLAGLAILLADGNNRGGGDLRSEHPIIGSWAGDDIVIAGDYADARRFCPHDAGDDVNLYHYADEHFKDISDDLAADLAERAEWYWQDKKAPPKLAAAIKAHQREKRAEERAKPTKGKD